MLRNHRRQERPIGFTIIELLVVVSIMSVLVTLLLPALGNAREVSKSIKCMANLHQIGVGLQVYTNENNGKCPPLQDTTSFFNAMWMTKLAKQNIVSAPESGETASPYMCPSGPLQLTTVSVDPASQYTDNGYVLMEGDSLPGGTWKKYAVNYAVNGTATAGLASWDASIPVTEFFPFVFWSATTLNPKPVSANLNNVVDATRVPLVFDGLWSHNQKAVRFTLRHGSGSSAFTNSVMLDGHVRSLAASDIPTPSDNMNNSTVLKTNASGRWAVTMIVKTIP